MSKLRKNLLYAAKITAAAIIAILLAELLKLQFSVSAGIVAILSVAFTKKETIETARNRLLAFLVALAIAAACFYSIGFNNYGFFVYLAVFIPVCMIFGWNSAMAMDSVLISHFLTLRSMNLSALSNEAALFVIGVGIGILSNIFLHRNADYMSAMKRETDELMKTALHRMSLRIMNPDMISMKNMITMMSLKNSSMIIPVSSAEALTLITASLHASNAKEQALQPASSAVALVQTT